MRVKATQYEGYCVSDDGRVFGKDGRELRQGPNDNGYMRVWLRVSGRYKAVSVHSLVATAFIGKRPENCQARHLDGNQRNNSASNVVWGTLAENVADRKRHKNSRQKLTAEQVVDAASRVAAGASRAALAAEFGVTHRALASAIYRFKHRPVVFER